VNLTPKELERLTVFNAAELARRRKARGLRLNHPETVAYVADWVCEGAREGESVATLREEATQLLSRADVMEGVPEMVDTIQVEPVFPDGTKLVTIHDPIRADTPDQLDDVPTYGRRPVAGGEDVDDADRGAGDGDAVADGGRATAGAEATDRGAGDGDGDANADRATGDGDAVPDGGRRPGAESLPGGDADR